MISNEFLITARLSDSRDLYNKWFESIYALFSHDGVPDDFKRSLIGMGALFDDGAILKAGFFNDKSKAHNDLLGEDQLDVDRPYICLSIEQGKHPACPDHLLFDTTFNPGPEGEKWSRFRIKTNMFSYDDFDYPDEYTEYPARRPSHYEDYTKEEILSHPVMLMDQMPDDVADKVFDSFMEVLTDRIVNVFEKQKVVQPYLAKPPSL